MSAAPSDVYQLIMKLSRQRLPSHRGDAHRLEVLRNIVIGYGWSHEPLLQMATHRLSFQQLLGEHPYQAFSSVRRPNWQYFEIRLVKAISLTIKKRFSLAASARKGMENPSIIQDLMKQNREFR